MDYTQVQNVYIRFEQTIWQPKIFIMIFAIGKTKKVCTKTTKIINHHSTKLFNLNDENV